MRAFATDGFGQPGAVRKLPDPTVGAGEVLVRVAAASLNTTDLVVMAGWLKDFLEHVFPLVPGIDASGEVERVGPGVTEYHEGDRVFGYTRRPVMGRGTLAELATLPVDGILRLPRSLEHHQAAVIPHSSLTAAAAVAAAQLRPGQRVVCLGATGGVGSYATQLAAAAGAPVIAITRGDYAQYARSLGAADVIDYTSAEPATAVRDLFPDGIDVLFDLAGLPELVPGLAALVRPGGKVVSTLLPPDEALAARGVEGFLVARFAAEDQFEDITAKIVEGRLKLPSIQTFGFDQIDEALALQATRHVRGKLAILIS